VKKKLFNSLRGLLLLTALVSVLFPLVWVTLASFKTPSQLNDPSLLFFDPNFENWLYVIDRGILDAALRSATVATITVIISAIAGSTAAYVISTYKAGGNATRFGILAAQVLPPAVLVFPFLTLA